MAAPRKSSASPIIAEFNFDHPTAGALQFKQVAEPNGARPSIGSVYITKEAASKAGWGDFKKVKVTVEPVA